MSERLRSTMRRLVFALSATGSTLGVLSYPGSAAATDWGTYSHPFAADSFWNSRPVSPVLGDFVIPKSEYYPAVSSGAYSTGVFLSSPDDGPVTVTGITGSKGLWDPDSETYHNVTIPHWPGDVVPASGSDGHADIVDPEAGMIHSFYQLQQNSGQWQAGLYAWSKLDGRGWGDPAHYFQGARATGVPSSAGLIRTQEINDGDALYHHALAMSLTYNALAPKPSYIFPATSSDSNAASTNTGEIPEGALVMLPASFDSASISSTALRKVVETLKAYGAYVVDRNQGTPFVIYVENGSGFTLNSGGWSTQVADDLDRIRAALRQVMSVGGWLDGNGQSFVANKNLNILSMRGNWQLQSGTTPGAYETWKQAVVFPAVSQPSVQVNYSTRVISSVTWGIPVVGDTYKLTAVTTGGGMLHLKLYDKSAKKYFYDSGPLKDGESDQFVWSASNFVPVLYAISGTGAGSSVGGQLVRVGGD